MKDTNRHIIDGKSLNKVNLSDEELWFSSGVADDTQTYDVDKAFDRFKERTHIGEKYKNHVHKRYLGMVAAVAVILLCFATVTAYWQGERSVQSHFSNIVVEAPLGSKTRMQLPDGSVICLNAGSRMVYSQGFGVNDRNIEFSGEGYFEVEKNPDLPFVVRTNDVNVTVLGTKFNFKDYSDDEEAVVNLIEGKVSLLNRLKEEEIRYLAPSEKMVLNKKTGQMDIVSSDKVLDSKGWTDNVLSFDEDLLPDIVKELERVYNVRIEITNGNLNQLRLYGSFDQQKQTVYDVLDVFTQTGRLEYKERNNVFYLK